MIARPLHEQAMSLPCNPLCPPEEISVQEISKKQQRTRRVSFSTVNVRTHNVEESIDKESQRSLTTLGWKVVDETSCSIESYETAIVAANFHRAQRRRRSVYIKPRFDRWEESRRSQSRTCGSATAMMVPKRSVD